MPRIAGDGAHRVEIECLPVENVLGEPFFQHLDQILRRAPTHEARCDARLFHHRLEVLHECQRDAACARLERKTIAQNARTFEEVCHQFADAQPIRRSCDLRGAADDLRRITNTWYFDDVIHIVALDLPRHGRERHEVIGDYEYTVRVHRIRQREAQRSAGALAVGAVGIAEHIRRRRGDYCDINVHFAVLDCLEASTMRAQHTESSHVALRAIVAKRAIHAAFDVMHHASFHQIDHRSLRRERRAREPAQVLHTHASRGLQYFQRHPVPIAQMMVRRDRHAIANAAFAQRGLDVGNALVSIRRIVTRGPHRRRSF